MGSHLRPNDMLLGTIPGAFRVRGQIRSDSVEDRPDRLGVQITPDFASERSENWSLAGIQLQVLTPL
jgi:hypothetical protein